MGKADEIWKRVNELSRERREFMKTAMKPIDDAQRAERKKLMEECGQIEHNFRFTNVGPLGNAWFTCMRCGMSKVED